jgi:tetratricopeptide (TPR) repeat protein
MAWVAFGASPKRDGQELFYQADFKAAAHAFEQELTNEPASARLHFWAGKSYARLADVSSLLFARRNARKAQAHLETAVRLAPGNRDYLIELFEFYVDSPEWFGGGLDRAAALAERLGPDEGGAPSRIVAQSRREYSGLGWAMRKRILQAGTLAGVVTPQI